MRHSSPSLTLISISFAIMSVVRNQLSVAGSTLAGDALLCANNGSTDHGPLTNKRLDRSLKSFRDVLPRLFAQEVHHLSFAVEAHDLAGNLPRVFHGR